MAFGLAQAMKYYLFLVLLTELNNSIFLLNNLVNNNLIIIEVLFSEEKTDLNKILTISKLNCSMIFKRLFQSQCPEPEQR
jgi:hypothetical protein